MIMTQKLVRYLSLSLVLLLLSTVAINTLPPRVQAAGEGSFIATELLDKAKRKNNFMWLRSCWANIDVDKIPVDEMDNWDFFERADGYGNSDERDRLIGNMYGPGADAVWSCFSGENVERAYGWLGFDNPREAFCAIDNAFAVETDGFNDEIGDTTECITREMSSGDFWDMGGDREEQYKQFEDSVKNHDDRVTGSGEHPEVLSGLPAEQDYVRYYLSFIEQCGTGDADAEITKDSYSPNDADGPEKYKITVVPKNGQPREVLAEGQSTTNSEVAIYATAYSGSDYKSGGQGGDTGRDAWPKGEVISCDQASSKINELASAYGAWVTQHPDSEGQNGTGGDNESDGDEGPSCWNNSGPLAWLLCPVLDVLDGAISLLDTWVNNLLFIDSDTGYASDGVKKGNAVMRNIALLLLVPMMMFMVIGTALNFGPFDPYTVKKALPRMLVATIFIVLSLPICQFAVEVSNTVGQGAGNLILSATDSDIDSLSAIFGSHGDSGGFAGLFLEGGAAAIGVLTLTWGVVGSFALVTIVALLIGFVILVMRQVLVMMLIVLAPLAIIVWIFPGNDKLWGIWKGTFQAMLLLYPIIAILIASGRFVASVVGGGN